jgi:hypothetical protein
VQARELSLAIPEQILVPLNMVEQASSRIAMYRGGLSDLRTISAGLGEISYLIERDPGIETAAVDLFSAAQALTASEPVCSAVRLRRLLEEATSRFRTRLGSARAAHPVHARTDDRPEAKAA